jgi:hypothetical protein
MGFLNNKCSFSFFKDKLQFKNKSLIFFNKREVENSKKMEKKKIEKRDNVEKE